MGMLLLSLDRSAHEMNSIEWQAIARKKLDPEVSKHLEQTRAEMGTAIGGLALHSLGPLPLKKVSTCYSAYKQAVDAEFELIAAGRMDEAEALDEKQVDPAFSALERSISAADAVYGDAARWRTQVANVGSILVVLFASGVIGLLFWRFSHARLAFQLARAEEGLLRGANEALQAEVAERKQVEESLARLNRQSETILNSAGEGILGLDMEGNHTFVNPAAAKMLGYEAGELIGRPSHSMWHHTKPDGSRYPEEECSIYSVLKDGAVHSRSDDVFWRKDGTSFHVAFVSTPIRAQGKVAGAVVTFSDTSAREKAEEALCQSRAAALNMMEDAVAARDRSEEASEALRQEVEERRKAEDEVRRLNAGLEQRVTERTAELQAANKEMEAFSYSVSHDLRAPLRSMNGFATILTEDYAPRLDEEGRRLLGTICSEAGRMGQMIDELLAFSRFGRQSMHMGRVDMLALAQSVFDQCAAQASGREIRFKLHPLPAAQGDMAMLSHVWSNLISNAIKYTRAKPVAEIEITGRVEDGQLLYCVKDNGAGFDMKYVRKLFGVFQRLHAEADFEGTGIGLSLVQRIVQRHGGRVWAEGEVNKGAAFYFTLPVVVEGSHQ
jgi:PAS domain S-box-containing protein